MNEFIDNEWHRLLPPYMRRAPLDPTATRKLTYSFYGKQLEVVWLAPTKIPGFEFDGGIN